MILLQLTFGGIASHDQVPGHRQQRDPQPQFEELFDKLHFMDGYQSGVGDCDL